MRLSGSAVLFISSSILTSVCAGAGCGAPAPPPPALPAPAPSAPGPSASPAPTPAPPGLRYPETRRENITDAMHGVTVADPYRWLERWDEPVRAWTVAQNRLAADEIARIDGFAAFQGRLRALRRGASPKFAGVVRAGDRFFARRSAPPRQQDDLVSMKSLEGEDLKVVFDPMRTDPSGATAIDGFVPSRDGKRVVVFWSKGGAEVGDAHLVDAATGADLGDVVRDVRLPGPGGSVAWDENGKGYLYSRHGCAGDPNAQAFCTTVAHHVIGTPDADDTVAFHEALPRIAEVQLAARDDGKYVALAVQDGDSRVLAHWLRGPKGRWVKVADFGDGVDALVFGDGDDLYVLSHAGASRRRVLRTKVTRPELASARVVVAESDGAIESVVLAGRRLVTVEHVGTPMRARAFDTAGKLLSAAPLPTPITIHEAVTDGADVVFHTEGFATPSTWYRWTPEGTVTKAKLSSAPTVDLSDLEVVEDACTSVDGTQIPLTVLQRKGTPRSGDNPTVLYGYGGFGVAESPRYAELRRIYLDGGVVYAVAGVRGGGEHGDRWHRDGALTHKQNVFDDFAACARRLVELRVTRPERLGAMGGSNGGLLMGAFVTQHPELVRAVVSRVGIYDMIRNETTTNGQFNTTEYGSVKDPAQFDAIYKYSPYHHVQASRAYPAILMTAGVNDGRVAAWQSRKFAAALQASGSPSPVLLLTRVDAGHGIGASLDQSIDDNVSGHAFLLHHLGVDLAVAAGAKTR